jgi:hypothetical protein
MAVDLEATKLSVDILKDIGLVPASFQMEGLWGENKIISLKD